MSKAITAKVRKRSFQKQVRLIQKVLRGYYLNRKSTERVLSNVPPDTVFPPADDEWGNPFSSNFFSDHVIGSMSGSERVLRVHRA